MEGDRALGRRRGPVPPPRDRRRLRREPRPHPGRRPDRGGEGLRPGAGGGGVAPRGQGGRLRRQAGHVHGRRGGVPPDAGRAGRDRRLGRPRRRGGVEGRLADAVPRPQARLPAAVRERRRGAGGGLRAAPGARARRDRQVGGQPWPRRVDRARRARAQDRRRARGQDTQPPGGRRRDRERAGRVRPRARPAPDRDGAADGDRRHARAGARAGADGALGAGPVRLARRPLDGAAGPARHLPPPAGRRPQQARDRRQGGGQVLREPRQGRRPPAARRLVRGRRGRGARAASGRASPAASSTPRRAARPCSRRRSRPSGATPSSSSSPSTRS